MRKTFYFVLLAVVCLACEPHVKYFNANPAALQTIGTTKLSWRISAGSGELSANPTPIIPTLTPPQKVNQEGTMDVTICKTTTFKLALPYGGASTVTVNVAQPCPCNQQTLTFTGTCATKDTPPAYPGSQIATLQVVGPGTLKDLFIDAKFPVLVHHVVDIGFDATGHPPNLPFNPPLPAAGTYSIFSTSSQICKDSGAGDPSMGGAVPAPDVHLTVIPNCVP